eukprot:sb/3478133/
MQDEKKYYELELVNRESNYNRVFKSAPKIGVMNPMNAKTKVKYPLPPSPQQNSILGIFKPVSPTPPRPGKPGCFDGFFKPVSLPPAVEEVKIRNVHEEQNSDG